MPAEPVAPVSAQDDVPLVERTELRDVRLISIRAKNQERPGHDVQVHVNMDKWAYKIEPGTLLITLRTEAIYSEHSDQIEAGSKKDRARLGRVVVTHLAELGLQGDPETVSRARIEEFLGNNLMFMMYPYVRASLQRYAVDLLLPPVLLPYLRRDVPTRTGLERSKDEESNPS